jgi:hypothetical protein
MLLRHAFRQHLKNLLRRRLGTGVIVTVPWTRAIRQGEFLADAVRAVDAGVDLLLLCDGRSATCISGSLSGR